MEIEKKEVAILQGVIDVILGEGQKLFELYEALDDPDNPQLLPDELETIREVGLRTSYANFVLNTVVEQIIAREQAVGVIDIGITA